MRSDRRWVLGEYVRRCLTGGGGGRKGVGRAWGAGESAVLQSGKCCAFTGLAAFAASPGGIRRLPVSKLPASVGFLPVALLIVMQQFDCSC